ncbi:DUF6468 domain-containing protein [Azospirillum doebereinerae]|uniref:DUF6468 domain-containing protein n=1 Tax=Azospirillum doebereinerae TaxID=92933 RepID=A0A433J420_9PROT|nr:DUF6468 domain-containing protein [Azospirillum doebereinerae]MCG5240985.1 DUF6468 domain-containing protein [Azospirillum doebereinerae]RUQ66593.1 hypothetical protein EJ913_22455 [Azospirillum doebereinerae]
MVSFLIDAALAVLLVTATVYLVLVNKRLKLLRTGQSEINTLVTSFSRSIDETDASMKRLVASATETASRLAEDLDRAKGVREDMTLILGSCERTATRMEESLQHARALLRRLDEGAMRPARPRPAGIPMEELMPASEPAPAVRRAEPVETPSDAATDATQESGSGEFRPLGLPQRAGAPDTAPVPPSKPAPTPAVAPTATPAEPPRPMAVGAFYARLRTVGSEG